MTTESCDKVATNFMCVKCDYYTCRKSSYDKHILTDKHNKQQLATNGNCKVARAECSKCGKIYKDRSGLWRHYKKCQITKEENTELNDKDLIMLLINENKEFRNLLLEQCKENSDIKNMMLKVMENGTNNNNNNNNTTNSHNKSFNLQFFLNETCKDAMNISDFLDSIQLQLSDLEKMEEIGFVEGISNIIIKKLNALDVSKRPIHCTDKKRETIYKEYGKKM